MKTRPAPPCGNSETEAAQRVAAKRWATKEIGHKRDAFSPVIWCCHAARFCNELVSTQLAKPTSSERCSCPFCFEVATPVRAHQSLPTLPMPSMLCWTTFAGVTSLRVNHSWRSGGGNSSGFPIEQFWNGRGEQSQTETQKAPLRFSMQRDQFCTLHCSTLKTGEALEKWIVLWRQEELCRDKKAFGTTDTIPKCSYWSS